MTETLRTGRLRLRAWRDADAEPFARLNADPEVMRHFPRPLLRAESNALIERIRAHFDRHGFGFWAAETVSSGELIGFVGLANVSFDAPFTPAIEIGWRLARSAWGQGFATEGTRAAVDFAFRRIAVTKLVSFTVAANARSRAVMERLGMTHDAADDFDHPLLPEGHPLRRHILYRLRSSGH